MKKFLILIPLFFSIYGTAYSQWVQQYPVTQFVNLNDVNFLNETTGWACGDGGLILKTTNQGMNWSEQITGVTRRLDRISIVDENILYIVGQFQTIIKTTNGGDNWIVLSTGKSGPSYYSTFFLNKDTGFVAGTLQNVWKTTNGGLNFTPTFVPGASWFFDIYFRNDNEGIISGEGSVYKTSNAGVNWQSIYFETNIFDEISFINKDTGYIVALFTNQLYKTTNFGSTWDSVSMVPYIDDSYAIFFANNDTGWIAGSSGNMLKTTNGGFNWYLIDMAQSNQGYIDDIHFVNDTTGWVVGAATKILFTTNGGGPVLSISNISNEIPDGFSLEQNFPNPFNSQTSISFKIPKSSVIKLEIFDVLGRIVDNEDFGFKTAGEYMIKYNAGKLSSGVYFYRLNTNDEFQIKKFTLVK